MLIHLLVVFIFVFILLQQCLAGDDGSASLDGSFPLKNGTITKITDYNRMDQCMAEPGYFHVHHNSLVIFLQGHEFCGGGPFGEEGLLICYKGQMDEKETMRRGLKPTRQFELQNVPGNAVAKRCEEAGHPNWHGILIYTNDQGQWVIKFSTTNRTFVIPGSGSDRLELLVYKLASAKDGGESFLSKTFGPKRDFMEWGKRDGFGAAEEAANRISNPGNEQLKKLFMELVKDQALLRNYVGIWSLGLDMLPTDENVYHLDMYTQKSECCKNIHVFFNLPTAQYPDPQKEKVDLKDGAIIIPGNLVENFTATLDGIVKKDAKILSFELVDLFEPDDKAQGIRLTVNFTGTFILFQQKIGKNAWTDIKNTTKIKHYFAPGVAFHLIFTLRKKEVIINMNCYGEISLPVDPIMNKNEIDFKNRQRITMDGDFQWKNPIKFYAAGKQPDIGFQWLIEEGINVNNSNGIVLRGEVDENAKKFSIKLWNKGGDGFFEPILELEVGIASQGFGISNGSKNDKGEDLPKKPTYNGGSPFEALIQFKEGTFDIWMNNTKIFQYPAGLRVVNYVQILGDASGDMIQLLKMPITCEYQMSADDRKSLEIFGKVLPSKGASFKIELITATLSNPIKNLTNLRMVFEFGENDALKIVAIELIDGSEYTALEMVDPNLKMGQFMQIKIIYKSTSQIGLTINDDEERFVNSDSTFEVTSKYKISGDFILEKLNLNTTKSCV